MVGPALGNKVNVIRKYIFVGLSTSFRRFYYSQQLLYGVTALCICVILLSLNTIVGTLCV